MIREFIIKVENEEHHVIVHGIHGMNYEQIETTNPVTATERAYLKNCVDSILGEEDHVNDGQPWFSGMTDGQFES